MRTSTWCIDLQQVSVDIEHRCLNIGEQHPRNGLLPLSSFYLARDQHEDHLSRRSTVKNIRAEAEAEAKSFKLPSDCAEIFNLAVTKQSVLVFSIRFVSHVVFLTQR